MKKSIVSILLILMTIAYVNGKTIVKLLLPNNCKSSLTTIDEIANSRINKIGLYPNPNGGSFKLSVSFISNIDNATINIYNLMGELVHSEKICSDSEKYEKNLSLNDLVSGIYFVCVINRNQEVSTKLIIK